MGVAALIFEIVVFVIATRPHATLKKPLIILVVSLVFAICLAFGIRHLGKRWEVGVPAQVIESIVWWFGIVMYWIGKAKKK